MIPQIILPSILTYDLKNKRFLHDRTLMSIPGHFPSPVRR